MTLRTVHTKTEKTNSIYPSNPKPFPPPIKITTIFYMILSASRRTDIPAFFSDWFYKRIEEGLFMVRNLMNVHRVPKFPFLRKMSSALFSGQKIRLMILLRL